jgi:hypothetical protein
VGIKGVKRMVKKKFIIFRNQIRDFCRKGWESKVIGAKGLIIIVEAEIPEEDMADRNTMRIEDLINEPGEW